MNSNKLETPILDQKQRITILGDSTIDNKAWVSGIYWSIAKDYLGITRDDTATRIKKSHGIFGPKLSIIEHLIDLMPNYLIHDYTNDGFTTHDVLHGAFRDKVFGMGTLPTMFPHQFFAPIREAENDIKNSNYIILSIGGNNFREFLSQFLRKDITKIDPESLAYNLKKLLYNMQKEYLHIVWKLQQLNNDAQIILLTQYYPSVKQNDYKIYPLLEQIGHKLGIGQNGLDVIYYLMTQTYQPIIDLVPNNVIVADITSSLDPFDSDNHVSQIEPSAHGGKKIAMMLKHIISSQPTSRTAYQFLPEFFENRKNHHQDEFVKRVDFDDWKPLHPNTFKADGVRDLKTTEKISSKSIEKEPTHLSSSIPPKKEVSDSLETPLSYNLFYARDRLIEASQEGLEEVLTQINDNGDDLNQLTNFINKNDRIKLWAEIRDNLYKSIANEQTIKNNKLVDAISSLKVFKPTDTPDKIKQKTRWNKLMMKTIVDLLSSSKIDFSLRDARGFNVIHIAILKRNVECLQRLIERFPEAINIEIDSPKTNQVNQNSFFSMNTLNPPLTPLDLALDLNDQELINLLIKKGALTKNRTSNIETLSSNFTNQ